MRTFIDYYAVLEIAAECCQDDIRKSYRALVKKFHPDLHPHNNEATAKMQLINEAYLILSDTEAKALYDVEYRNFKRSKKQTQPEQSEPKVHEYRYQNDILNDWVSKARRQAKDLTEQALKDAGGIMREAGNGLLQGIVRVIAWIVIANFIFMACRACR